MKKFMDEDFLLHNETSKTLYHQFAKEMPIFDYHCHLSPKEIYEDKQFEDIAEVWLGGDHYKWRLMRANGTDEKYITGDGTGYEKFQAWAACLPYAMGNPLYHWSHLELQRYFGIEETLNEKTVDSIWNKANEKIQKAGFSARKLIEASNVYALCTTDDPADDLAYHIKLREDPTFKTKVLPAMRPDRALEIKDNEFVAYMSQLGTAAKMEIVSFADLCSALKSRIDFFDEVGCRASDHGFTALPYEDYTLDEIEIIFEKALKNQPITLKEADKYKTALLFFLGSEYKKKNWGMELHIGALRNNSTRSFETLGINTGFDSVYDGDVAVKLSKLLDHLDKEDNLPKTIVFTMNPRDNWVLASMIGNFQSKETVGKMQFGTAWWMQDHKDGMTEQMKCLSNSGLLGRFIGMLTDSRSFLSYPRHEYFRRILCNLVGTWIEEGEYPNDMEQTGKIIRDICFNNVVKYFEV